MKICLLSKKIFVENDKKYTSEEKSSQDVDLFVRIVGTRSAVSAEEPLRNSTLPSDQDTPSVFLLKQKSSSLREGAELTITSSCVKPLPPSMKEVAHEV